MRPLIFITLAAILSFSLEFIFFNLFNRWFRPDFLLLLVIFVSLYWGVRYGLFTAVFCGLLSDSAGTNVFGMHLFSFVVCVYFLAVLQKYVYTHGSRRSKVLIVFLVCGLNVFVEFVLMNVFQRVGFWETLWFVYFPEMLVTTLAATMVFQFFKRCVLKFSI